MPNFLCSHLPGQILLLYTPVPSNHRAPIPGLYAVSPLSSQPTPCRFGVGTDICCTSLLCDTYHSDRTVLCKTLYATPKMLRSLKMHNLVYDMERLLLSEPSPPLALPALTHSPTSSNENIDKMMPATPSTPHASPTLHPGFYFSTTDENVDPLEFHRVAAQLLSGESIKRDSAIGTETCTQDRARQLHCDLGKDPMGRFCCSCGKSYPASSKLHRHIATCAGILRYPCSICDKVFETRTKLSRHVAARHNNNEEPCPECGHLFPAQHLAKHLASGISSCDGVIPESIGPDPEIDEAYRFSSRASASQQFWIHGGDLSWSQGKEQPRDSKYDDENYVPVEQTMGFVKSLLHQQVSQPDSLACDLCEETFGTDKDALAQHIGEHSLDFAERRHRCDECRISFANEKDLHRHLQSASVNSHCGFTFRHHSRACRGHHPPINHKSTKPLAASDHILMQKHVRAWELSQLRTHRVTVARILSQRIVQSQQRHMSIQDCKQAYLSLLPHVSIAIGDNTRPQSSWVQDRRDSETAHLDAYFSGIVSASFPEADTSAPQSTQKEKEHPEPRPDSGVITNLDSTKRIFSKRKSLLDLARRRATSIAGNVMHKQAHQRTHSGPIAFLRQQSLRDMLRPQSLPMPHLSATPAVRLMA